MTPLAHQIVKELTLPVKRRTFLDQSGLLERMENVHCFDVTEVFGLAGELADDLYSRAMATGTFSALETQTFLPAKRTWIEFRCNGRVEGVLLEKDQRGDFAVARWAIASEQLFASAEKSGALVLTDEPRPVVGDWVCVRDIPGESREMKEGWVFMVYALLAIINTPRLIGRKQHMPHRGLERKLANAKGLVGKFPLRAWTELKLSVSDIGRRADGCVHEAHYTGEKCLHFCRAHLRIANGKLVKVSAHWRGNPALGIKRTRYMVSV